MIRLKTLLIASVAVCVLANAEESGADADSATISGTVVAKDTHKPLSDCEVIVAIPATDMRMIRISPPKQTYRTKTDQDGKYQLHIPNISADTDASLDAFARNYRSSAGTYCSGGDLKTAKIKKGSRSEVSFELQPAAYVAGTVVDEDGKPISGIEIMSDLRANGGSAAIAQTVSATDGTFRIYDFPATNSRIFAKPRFGVTFENKDDSIAVSTVVPDSAAQKAGIQPGDILESVSGTPFKSLLEFRDLIARLPNGKHEVNLKRDSKSVTVEVELKQPEAVEEVGCLMFASPEYCETEWTEVYKVTAAERAAIRVTIKRGLSIVGSVLGQDGAPVANLKVEAVDKSGNPTKATQSDATGHFRLAGLPSEKLTVKAHAKALKQKGQLIFNGTADVKDAELKLSPASLKGTEKSYTVLEMKLIDATAETTAYYEGSASIGAVVISPGENVARLDIGTVEEGYCFFEVGEKDIKSVEEFVTEILAVVENQKPDKNQHYGCRVVFTTSRHVTDTEYLTLATEDIDALKALKKSFRKEDASGH
jgi:membrane-associated protease RseP (regulator of RpoE activity)